MKILITGSSGHLGEALVRALKALKFQVFGIDIQPSKFTDIVGSIADIETVKKAMYEVDVVMHTATLHKPHVVTHSKQDFIDTNVTGTLNLLEQSKLQNIKSFIFTSTTSTFGDSLRPATDKPAIWVNEDLSPQAKNIYGVTKIAAENLCQLFFRNHQLPCVVLKTSRFFPESDDDKGMRESYVDANIKANEFLFRRVDVADIVEAHILAMEKASDIGYGKYIISASSPFSKSDLIDLQSNAPKVVTKYFPDFQKLYATNNWQMFPNIGRVYVNTKAKEELGWNPQYDFQHILNSLKSGNDYRSELTRLIQSKGYHEDITFTDGPYPVDESGD
ncbi:MAG: NAD(P)-dependent oxidoreductase [Xanthomonadales bacterium]|nr:NAD(P)-dependent oxidoreductase [Xanthomonadales bacterium]